MALLPTMKRRVGKDDSQCTFIAQILAPLAVVSSLCGQGLLLGDVSVVDVSAGTVRNGQTVLIKGGRIDSVGPSASLSGAALVGRGASSSSGSV